MDDESYALIEEILRNDEGSRRINFPPLASEPKWQTVSFRRGRKNSVKPMLNFENSPSDNNEVAKLASFKYDGNAGGRSEHVKKRTKVKKEKVNVDNVARKMDASDLGAFLADIETLKEGQEFLMLMHFMDYFERVFAPVSAIQFQWVKTLKESSVVEMIDIPLSHMPKELFETSTKWLEKRSAEALSSFVLCLWDNIVSHIEIQQVSTKGPKNVIQQEPPKSQVAVFMILAMILRCKPEVLSCLMSLWRETSNYQEDTLPLIVWMITQACEGDLVVGMFMWINFLLPILNSKSSQSSTDLILQMLERIFTFPKADSILLNEAARKANRLVPPSALEVLMRATFPASSARVATTKRFKVVYSTLKEMALAGNLENEVMQQIMQLAMKASGEGVRELSNEATNLVIWCLTHYHGSYKQWDELYLDNLKASVLVLKKLADEWKVYSVNATMVKSLKAILTSFKKKNEKATWEKEGEFLKDAEKARKALVAQLPRDHTCTKGTIFVIFVALVVGATTSAIISHNNKGWELKKLLAGFI